ncbi:MAG: inorganic phosphate transporter family protein [Limnochordales bacterium]|nr:inorganic phosphate transporter [Limnochordales bacterium]
MTLLSLLILLSGVFVGWNLGANDAANAMGTAVGARVRTIREAVIIVAVFSLAGALAFGHRVIKTIGRGIVPLDQLDPRQATLIALAAMLAAGVWLLWATYLKLPVSTTHSTVGAVAGAGLAAGGVPIFWGQLVDIFLAWILTPVGAAIVAYVLYQALQILVMRHVAIPDRIWGWLLTASGMWMAFSWGANDVANATGVIVGASLMSPFAASLVGGLAIVLGIATWGYRVMETVGTRITHLIPPMAFIAEVAAALNVQLYTLLGLPVSTTHSIVGAVFGVGLVFGRAAIDPRTARDIVLAWAATPLAAGFVSAVLFLLLARIV